MGYFLRLWWSYTKKAFSLSVTFFACVMHLLQHVATPQCELAITCFHFLSESYRNDDAFSSLVKHSPSSLYSSFLLHGWKAWVSKQDCSDSHTSSPDSLLYYIQPSLGWNLLFLGWTSAASSLELRFHPWLLHSQWYLQTPTYAYVRALPATAHLQEDPLPGCIPSTVRTPA